MIVYYCCILESIESWHARENKVSEEMTSETIIFTGFQEVLPARLFHTFTRCKFDSRVHQEMALNKYFDIIARNSIMFFNGRDWIRWSVSFIDCASVTTGTTEHNQNHLMILFLCLCCW
jgi:hypothetical protein